jgi:hypothetical protein
VILVWVILALAAVVMLAAGHPAYAAILCVLALVLIAASAISGGPPR